MCIYLTTRHVHRDGRADSVTAEWELCPESNGRQPCPNKQRHERIVSAPRHKRNATIGSIATASTVSSTGPATPSSSSYRDDPYIMERPVEGRETPSSSGKAPQRDWSPLNEDARSETRRPKSPVIRQHRYRMSIDETLAADSTKRPTVLHESSASSGISSDRGPFSADAHGEMQDDSSFSDETARRLAKEALRRQERERKKEGSSSKSSTVDSLDDFPDMSRLHLTDSQKKEREEQMWDAHEVRTASRMEHRERMREENRRRRLSENLESQQNYEAEIKLDDEDLTRAKLVRQMAELEVEDGLRQQHELEEARLLAERAVLERKIAISAIEHDDAERGIYRGTSGREVEGPSRRRSILDGRMHRYRESGSSPRPSNSKGRVLRAQEIKDRIRENERELDAVEARIQERQRAEEKRQRHIRYLEQMIKVLDRKIETRSQYASALPSTASPDRSSQQHTSSSRSSPLDPVVEPAEESDRHAARASRHRRRRH